MSTMTRTLLHESTTASLERKGNVWEAVILTPGKGTSGTYSESMISEDITAAFPAGTKHWFNHPTEENPNRDPRDQWGVSVQAAEHEPGVGGKTRIKILEHWRPVIEALAEEGQAELSVWVMGETDDDGNVVHLFPDRQNSVDLVGYPGRPGSALTTKLLESARAGASPQPPAASAEDQRKKESMEKWEEAVFGINSKLDAFITKSEAAITAAEAAKTKAEADAQAALDSVDDKVKEALDAYKGKADAIEAAELLEPQRESLLKKAAAGEDITEPLAEAIAVVAAAKKLSEDSGGSFIRGSESATADAAASLPKGW